MNRVLSWSTFKSGGNHYSIGPTYYMEADYEPVAVRIYAEIAPSDGDAEFNIYDDGVSIFSNKASDTMYPMGGVQTTASAETNIFLGEENSQVDAENFQESLIIEEGSWVSCNCIQDGAGRNLSVHLELRPLSEDEESED